MAPMALEDAIPIKRTSTVAEFDNPVAKKLHRESLRRHAPTWNLDHHRRQEAPCQDGEIVQHLLTRSVSLALAAVGFDAAEPRAMESFRAEVEECKAQV